MPIFSYKLFSLLHKFDKMNTALLPLQLIQKKDKVRTIKIIKEKGLEK